MSPSNPLQTLRDLDRTSPHFHNQLIDFLRGNEYRDIAPNLQDEDLVWLVNYLDNVLSNVSDPSSEPFLEPLDELRRLCGVKNVLPKSCSLSDSLLGCVYEGSFNGSKVRIRRVRTPSKGDLQKAKETFHQVTVVWKHLAHPNIVPLLGATIDPPQLISDRMPGGDLTEYISTHPDTDRSSLLSDVAEGLSYLHSCNIVHGDLRGSNILVDASDHARVTDFGLAVVTQNLDSVRNNSDGCGDSARWIAPEILNGQMTCTKEADVFSFAMVTIEIFTCAIPFGNESVDTSISTIISGGRPLRPTHSSLTDKLWKLIQRCWDQDADRRPSALQISSSLCSDITAWKRLTDRPLPIDERISLIADLCSDRGKIEALKGLNGGDAQTLIDMIDEVVNRMMPSLRRKCLATLCKICSYYALIPRSMRIPLCYNRAEAPRYRGGFAEVWKGEHEGVAVAVKVLKIFVTSDLVRITRRFCKEIITWKALRHENVLPLLGVTMSENQFAMVSEWMANGNIHEFIKAHRDVNRFKLLEDVARGLIYMHGQVMVHGDLKGANIMIDKDGGARLADFGLLVIVSDSTHPVTTTPSEGAGTMRWMSPELLDPERFGSKNGRPTKESDCYALGMLILEVLTGQVPFPGYNNLVAMRKIVEGEQPERPQGPETVWFTDDLWVMLEQCWVIKPELRPTVEGVLERLKQGSATWEPLSLSMDSNSQVDSDDESFPAMSHQPLVTVGVSQQDGMEARVLSQHSPHVLPSDPQPSEQPAPEDEQHEIGLFQSSFLNNQYPCLPLGAMTTLAFSKSVKIQRDVAWYFDDFMRRLTQFIDCEALNPILHLLNSHDNSVRHYASGALVGLSKRVNPKSLIIDMGGLEAAIRHMSSPGTPIQQQMIRFIVSLIEGRAGNDDDRVTEPNVLVPLVQCRAVEVLVNMAQREQWRPKLVDAGIIPLLAESIGTFDTSTQCHGARGVEYIASDDANLEELMQSELKIVQTLVQFMGFPSPEVQRTAISALHMLRRHEKCPSEIIKANGLDPLFRLLHTPYRALHHLVVPLVCSLTVRPTSCSLIVEAGFLPLLVFALKNGETRLDAAKTLSALAASTENNKLEIVKAGVVQTIKELLVPEVSPNIQAEMIACIRSLSCSDELRDRILEMGIRRVLVRFSTRSRHPEVKEGSRAALRNLANGRETNFWRFLRK